MKIYTGAGDKGLTRLGNGTELSKDDGLIEALGAVDEINAWLGVIVARRLEARLLQKIQSDLFKIGSELSLSKFNYDDISADISKLESWIDSFDKSNKPLKNFILPGGTPEAAQLHYARTVCRRAEREVVRHLNNLKAQQVPFREEIIVYLNRLSDLLFVLARYYNGYGADDVIWKVTDVR